MLSIIRRAVNSVGVGVSKALNSAVSGVNHEWCCESWQHRAHNASRGNRLRTMSRMRTASAMTGVSRHHSLKPWCSPFGQGFISKGPVLNGKVC